MAFIYFLSFFIFDSVQAFLSQQDLALIKGQAKKPVVSLFEKGTLKKKPVLPSCKEALWWHYFPTIGLHSDTLTYPFLPHAFFLWELAPSMGKGVKVALFDTDVLPHSLIECQKINIQKQHSYNNKGPFYNHGTHIAGLIAGRFTIPIPAFISQDTILKLLDETKGVCGIAPQASIFSFNILHASGKPVPLSFLVQAVEQAYKKGVTVANISLAFDSYDDPLNKNRQKLEALLKNIPYVICSAGNAGTNRLSYPARMKDHIISVGSFGCTYKKTTHCFDCKVSLQSQYENGRGPHFLAPGEKILGCARSLQQSDSYMFCSGTSCATALVSGFFALVVGEFSTFFSKKQVLFVCQKSCFFLHNTPEWKKKSLWGVLDMRTALFTLHVLRSLHDEYTYKMMSFDLFACYVERIHTVLFECPFKNGFFDYCSAFFQNTNIQKFHDHETFHSLPKALQYIKMKILEGVS